METGKGFLRVQRRHRSTVVAASIAGHKAAELAVGEKAAQRREDALTFVHPSMLRNRRRKRRVFQIAANKEQMEYIFFAALASSESVSLADRFLDNDSRCT